MMDILVASWNLSVACVLKRVYLNMDMHCIKINKYTSYEMGMCGLHHDSKKLLSETALARILERRRKKCGL